MSMNAQRSASYWPCTVLESVSVLEVLTRCLEEWQGVLATQAAPQLGRVDGAAARGHRGVVLLVGQSALLPKGRVARGKGRDVLVCTGVVETQQGGAGVQQERQLVHQNLITTNRETSRDYVLI